MAKKKETDGIPMLMEAPSTGLTVPSSFKIGDQSYNKETLIAQRDKDVQLVIRGIDDKEGYKSAVALRGQYRTLRTTLEKVRKEHFKPLQDYLKDYKAKTDELGAEAAIAETYFDEMITAVDDEKERIKQQAIIDEQKRIQGRINEMAKLGSFFDGENYTFPYAPGVCLSVTGLAVLDEKGWPCFIEELTEDYNREQTRIENERVAKEQTDLLITQQAEQNKQDALALTEKRTKLRVKELKLMQFEETVMGDGDNLFEHEHSDRFFCLRDIQTLSDEDWEKRIEYHETKIMETRNVIAAKSMEVETPPVEPIADVQDPQTNNQVTEDQWTEEYTGTQGNEVVDANNIIVEDDLKDVYQPLFDLMYEHGLTLLHDEMDEIINMVRWMDGKEPNDYSLNKFEKWVKDEMFVITKTTRKHIICAIDEFKEIRIR